MVTVAGVVFDFYGTLVANPAAAVHRAGADRVAAALGLSGEAYYRVLLDTFTERATGVCGGLEDTMRWVAARCEHEPTSAQLAAACAVRRTNEEAYVRALRPDAETTLSSLRSAGIRIGLISDCTHELREVWPTLPIAPYVDAAIFSVEIGVRKPDQRLYSAATEALGVSAAECIYVGDGGSGELTGAAIAGMRAYQLVAPDSAHGVVYDADTWTGPTINALSDVLVLADVATV